LSPGSLGRLLKLQPSRVAREEGGSRGNQGFPVLKHEEEPTAPAYAERLVELLST